MRKTFWLPITLALVAYLALPLPGLSAPLKQRIDKKREQIAAARTRRASSPRPSSSSATA